MVHEVWEFGFTFRGFSHLVFCMEVLTNHPVEQRLSFVLGMSVKYRKRILTPAFLPVRPSMSGFGTFAKDLSAHFKFG